MRAGDLASTKAGALFIAADNVKAIAHAKIRSRAWFEETRKKSVRAVIVYLLFLAFIGAALLFGDPAMIDSLFQPAIEAREAKGGGEIVYKMRDGMLCRQMFFDNATATMTERPMERCPDSIAAELVRARRGFAWGVQ